MKAPRDIASHGASLTSLLQPPRKSCSKSLTATRTPSSPTWHSYKLAAALQHAQAKTGDCASPILLQIAWGYGHTVGGLPERANQIAFLTDVLGLKIPSTWAEATSSDR